MKNVIILALFFIILAISVSNHTLLGKITKGIIVQTTNHNEAQVAAKVENPNINEILWLWHKYKIRKIYSHCLVTDTERKAQNEQQNAISLKYGNSFWQIVKNEVDSIEFHHLGYQKANLNALEIHLNKNNFTINPLKNSKPVKKYIGYTNFTIQPNGQLSNIDLHLDTSINVNFTKEKLDSISRNLKKLFSNPPLCRPSNFLNHPIVDSTSVFLYSMGR